MPPPTRKIGFLIYEGLQSLDLVGPFDAFGAANECVAGGRQPYALETIGLDADPVKAENGLTLVPDVALEACPALDTLVIPGGRGSRKLNQDSRLLGWIRERSRDTRRVVSTCTGIYLLAATGLLDGRRATTHWRFEEDIRKQFPRVRLDVDQLYVRDGPFHTSGGLTASMDMTLALVESDLGSPIALATARHLVMYMKRPGNQAQFSEPLRAQAGGQGPLARLPEWLLEHLAEDLTVERMADQVNMSERNFRRVFTRTFNSSPTRYLERLRLDHARMLLTSTRHPVDRVAARVGFDNPDSFRRVFRRHYGASPREYRQRFA